MSTRTTRLLPSRKAARAAGWTLAALVAPLAAHADAPCRISEVREELIGSAAHLIVAGARDFEYRSPSARSVVIHLPGCVPAFDAGTLRLTSPLVISSRLGVSEGPEVGSTLTLELRPGATYRLFSADAAVHLVVEGPEESVSAATLAPTVAPTETPEPTAAPEPTRTVEVEIETPRPTAAPVSAIPPTEEPSPAVAAATLAPTTAPEPTAAPIASVEPVLEPATPDGPASRIVGIRAEQRAGEIVITIDADGRIESYRDFRLPDPERVGVDFRGLTLGPRVVAPTLPGGTLRIRTAQFKRAPAIARVVLDIPTRVAYRIAAEGRSLAIVVTTD